MSKDFILVMMAMFSVGCEQEKRTDWSEDPTQTESSGEPILFINEFCAKSSELNEFGEPSDWIELFNPEDSALIIKSKEWSISDREEKEKRFYLPAIEIPAKGYAILWCDGLGKVEKDIHTDFKLSSKGETIYLYYQDELVDSKSYSSLKSSNGCSCRETDGSSIWVENVVSSAGKKN